jgi:hypothetical protein
MIRTYNESCPKKHKKSKTNPKPIQTQCKPYPNPMQTQFQPKKKPRLFPQTGLHIKKITQPIGATRPCEPSRAAYAADALVSYSVSHSSGYSDTNSQKEPSFATAVHISFSAIITYSSLPKIHTITVATQYQISTHLPPHLTAPKITRTKISVYSLYLTAHTDIIDAKQKHRR